MLSSTTRTTCITVCIPSTTGKTTAIAAAAWLPDMPRDGSFVAGGSRIYVFGEINSFSINCTSHTVQHLPKRPVRMSDTVAGVIGRRIYVVGYLDGSTDRKYTDAILVFDTETQMWEDGITMSVMKTCIGSPVVMADKLYMKSFENSFVYDPKESKWETDKVLDSKDWGEACVVDDVLYFYDRSDKELRAYDPEDKCWEVVKGLDDFLAEMRRVGFGSWSTVSYGGKLVLLYGKGEYSWIAKEIFCAEVSLERRKGGQIWGKVDQWCNHALIAGQFYH